MKLGHHKIKKATKIAPRNKTMPSFCTSQYVLDTSEQKFCVAILKGFNLDQVSDFFHFLLMYLGFTILC